MSTIQTRACGRALIVSACLLAFAGCGGKVEEPEEPPVPMEESESEAVFPIILHDQQIQALGYTWRVQAADISDVELLERTEDESTGNQTAELWFHSELNTQRLKVKVRVVYKRLTNQSDTGIDVFSYPVSKVTTLEAEWIDE